MDDQRRIALLEARVAALEEAIERRSRELRRIQQQVCRRDLLSISRLQAGFPPMPRGAYELTFWHETVGLRAADVEETLADLWRSLSPPRDSDQDEAG